MADDMQQQDLKIRQNMDKIGRKILIMSGKGGVGKTTVTVNLANALADMGATVGILDTDLHGPNVAKMLGCEGEVMEANEDGTLISPVTAANGVKVVSLSFALADDSDAVIFRGPMKISVIRQFLSDVDWGTLDYLLIDSPPGTGDEQLTVCQSIPALTGCIIVTTPQQVAVLDCRKSVTFARKVETPIIGVVENMSCLICPDCGKEIPVFGKDGGKNMCMEMGVPLLGQIPMELGLQDSEDNGRNWLSDKNSRSAKAIMEIASFINSTVSPTKSEDIYLNSNPSCSPSACATCHLDCPSKKNQQ